MRRANGIYISAEFILMFSALFFFDSSGIVSAIFAAAALHEAGHIGALYLLGAKLTRLTVRLSGLRLDYAGALSGAGELIAAAAGPFTGILGAFMLSVAARLTSNDFLLCTAGVSFIFSLFNLLPAKPLDGGRILHIILQKLKGSRFADMALLFCGAFCSLSLIALGLWFTARGYGLAMVLAGLWLSVCVFNDTCKYSRPDIK